MRGQFFALTTAGGSYTFSKHQNSSRGQHLAYVDNEPPDWPDVTLATVLNNREDLLVELAATKELAIDVLRRHLAERRGQTRLRNVVGNVESLALDKNEALYQYFKWLMDITAHLNLSSIGDLAETLAPFNSNKAIGNVNGNRRNGTYDYGLVARRNRNPWGEIRVKTVQTVLARTDALVAKVQRRFDGREYREVLEYIENRIRCSRGALSITELVQPTACIVAVALSTNAKHVGIYQRMWGGDQDRNHICSRRTALAHVNRRHRRAAVGGSSGGWEGLIDTISETIVSSQIAGIPVLFTINAPLGWPVAMTEVLAKHEAGAAIPNLHIAVDAHVGDQDGRDRLNFGHTETVQEKRWRHERNLFFRRLTEQIVRDVRGRRGGAFGPSGLDVGADKSARTAHQALRLLKAIRARTELPIPVVTDRCGPIVRTSAIEVSTFWPRGPRVRTGKADNLQIDARIEKYDDNYGAASAASEAMAFLEGRVACPRDHGVDEDVARREGWIWYSRELDQAVVPG